MSQNRSNAVMATRVEPDDSLDDFPTQPWGTRALCELLVKEFGSLGRSNVWEPTCNRGFMARPLSEYFGRVYASDVHNYGWQGMGEQCDFLFPGSAAWIGADIDFVVTNPPFRLASEFVYKALYTAKLGVAMLVRTSFLEGAERYRELFSLRPPNIAWQFVERLPMNRGKCERDMTTATAYMWLFWKLGEGGETRLRWIAPCRKRLERSDDYKD